MNGRDLYQKRLDAFDRKDIREKLASFGDFNLRRGISWEYVIHSIYKDIKKGKASESERQYFKGFISGKNDLILRCHKVKFGEYFKDSSIDITTYLEPEFSAGKFELDGRFDDGAYIAWKGYIHEMWSKITSPGLLGNKKGLEKLEERLGGKLNDFDKAEKTIDDKKQYVIRENLERLVAYLRKKRGVDGLFGFDYVLAFDRDDYDRFDANIKRLTSKLTNEDFGNDIFVCASLKGALEQKRIELRRYMSRNLSDNMNDGYIKHLEKGFAYLENILDKRIKIFKRNKEVIREEFEREKELNRRKEIEIEKAVYGIKRDLGFIDNHALYVEKLREKVQDVVRGSDPDLLRRAIEGVNVKEEGKRYIDNALAVCELFKRAGRRVKKEEVVIKKTITFDKDVLGKFMIAVDENNIPNDVEIKYRQAA